MSSRSLGQLTLDLIAKTGSFTGPLDQASRNARKNMDDVGSSVTKAATALASLGAASAGAMGAMVLSVAQSAKELEQLTTLANASNAEFQRMAYGAKSAGVEQDKLASIFKDTTDRIGEFMSRGGGEMQDFFEEIAPLVGVTAEQFKGLSGPEALQLYYNSLEKANVGQQRLTSYMEQVADDATALIPLLQNNGEKFQAMGDEAERLGLVLSDLELDQLKDASAAIDAMQAAMQGATNQLVVGMLPAINEFTDFLRDESTLNGIGAIIDGLEMVADVGAVAALVLGSRFVSSVSASGFAMIAANLEATRYQATLARMAGVSATTAAGITAMSVATRGASAAMALVGGPMGAVILAGTALTYFATRASEAEREAEELDRRITQMGNSFEGFTVAQAERGILDYTAKLKEAERELSTAEARLFSLNKRMEEFPGSAKYDEWKEDAIRAAGAVDDAQQKVDALNGNLEKLNQLAQGGAGKDLADDANKASKAYEELNKQVGQQIIMLSAKTDAERLAAQVAAGYVEGLTETELAQIQALYEARDALEAKLEAEKEATKQTERRAEAGRRAAAAVAESVQALVAEANQLGMTNEQIRLNELRIKGATEAQLKQARAALEVVAAHKAQEDYKQLLLDLRTEEEKLTDQLHERLAVLDAIRNLPPEERESAVGRIADAAFQDAPEFAGLAPEIGGPFGELGKIDDAQAEQEDWYARQLEMLEEFRSQKAELAAEWDAKEQSLKQQHEEQIGKIEQARHMAQLSAAASVFGDLANMTREFAGEQSGIYKAMFAAQQAVQIAMILANTEVAAAAVLAHDAGILGLGAVATSNLVRTMGYASAGMVAGLAIGDLAGMAHDGIDAIPEDGTWFLQKGERVTTAQTSDKLDRTLEQVRQGQQNGGSGPANVTVNLIEDRSRAGQVEQRQREDGSSEINAFVADIGSGGERAQMLEQTYGLQRRGR